MRIPNAISDSHVVDSTSVHLGGRYMPDNFDYYTGKKAQKGDAGRSFKVGKVVFIGPLKNTVDQ